MNIMMKWQTLVSCNVPGKSNNNNQSWHRFVIILLSIAWLFCVCVKIQFTIYIFLSFFPFFFVSLLFGQQQIGFNAHKIMMMIIIINIITIIAIHSGCFAHLQSFCRRRIGGHFDNYSGLRFLFESKKKKNSFLKSFLFKNQNYIHTYLITKTKIIWNINNSFVNRIRP